MSSSKDDGETPPAAIAEHVAAVIRELRAEMDRRGLTKANGWEILERVIDQSGGSVWVFLPMHREETAPEGLGAAVAIDSHGRLRP